jgi:alanine-glyoxylate transaminase/serine-glyoxylate transaminase/serine-pyruvate transaminase
MHLTPHGPRPGFQFLQIPGPTNVPGEILGAIAQPTIDHRGPEFRALAEDVHAGLRSVFRTEGPVVVYPSSGTGAWEAALTNTLSPGDRVLMFETGHFSALWRDLATRLQLSVELVPGDWRRGADPEVLEARLGEDRDHGIKAVAVVHNETATGVASRIPEIRGAMDRAKHPALLLVDTISSLGSMDYRHDEWGVDVTISCSQKGLMLPPGLGFNAMSAKALAASAHARMPRAYWSWEDMLRNNEQGFFPYTPATNLLYGLREAIRRLLAEGLDRVFARHARHAEATRRAVRHWGLELQCEDPREFSGSLTAVRVPDGHDADAFRELVREHFGMALGGGLSRLTGRVFRIGHLGDFNDLMLAATLSGVQLGLGLAHIPHSTGGVQAALDYLEGQARNTIAVKAPMARASTEPVA